MVTFLKKILSIDPPSFPNKWVKSRVQVVSYFSYQWKHILLMCQNIAFIFLITTIHGQCTMNEKHNSESFSSEESPKFSSLAFELQRRSLFNFHFVRLNSKVHEVRLNSDVSIQHIRYFSKYPSFLLTTDLARVSS